MSDEHFEVVTVETDRPGQMRNVTNTRQAGEMLAGSWPEAHRGAKYRVAVKAVMDHLRLRKSTEAVHETFIAAAEEADILVREGRKFD